MESSLAEVERAAPRPQQLEPVRQLLASWSLGQFLRTKPPKSVLTLSTSHNVGQALKTLATNHIQAAPLFDGDQYLGFLDVDRIVHALLALVNVWELTEDTRASRLRSAGLQLEHQALSSLGAGCDGALIYKADLSSSLLDVIVHGFLATSNPELQQVVHRVGVFELCDGDDDEDDLAAVTRLTQGVEQMEAADAALGVPGIRVTHVVSQSDVLGFVQRHSAALGSLGNETLEALGLAVKQVVCVPAEMATINALAAMVTSRVTSVGVVSHGPSHGGSLAACLSASDLTGLLPQHFGQLAVPVLQFLGARAAAAGGGRRDTGWGAAAAPGGRGSAAALWGLKGAECLKQLQVVTCAPTSTLRAVIDTLAAKRVHRVYVVDEASRPVGVVTITDVLRLLVGWQPTSASAGGGSEVQQLAARETGRMDNDA